MKQPLVLLIASHHIFNVPPFTNVTRQLAKHGLNTIIIGYQKDNLPKVEKLSKGAYIIRLNLLSRQIPLTNLRKIAAVFELLITALVIIKRIQPEKIITFSDPSAILLKFLNRNNKIIKINWLLEFPEFERMDFLKKMLIRYSTSCWKFADIMVTPTKERMALSICLQPKCLSQKHFIVHNSPIKYQTHSRNISDNTKLALKFLQKEKNKGYIILIYAGAIGDRYGIDSIIKAVGEIKTGISLLLLGKKHNLSLYEVEKAMKEADSPDNIFWVDSIAYNELQEILPYGDIGFATYHGDTLNTFFSAPGKIYEYLKAGLVILTDNQCCIYNELLNYDCGIYFTKPISHTAIKNALDSILDQQNKLQRMKKSALNLYHQELCLEKQISPLISYLKGMKQII